MENNKGLWIDSQIHDKKRIKKKEKRKAHESTSLHPLLFSNQANPWRFRFRKSAKQSQSATFTADERLAILEVIALTHWRTWAVLSFLWQSGGL